MHVSCKSKVVALARTVALTNASLDHLADQAGIGVAHLGVGMHLFHDVLPDWVAPYFR